MSTMNDREALIAGLHRMHMDATALRDSIAAYGEPLKLLWPHAQELVVQLDIRLNRLGSPPAPRRKTTLDAPGRERLDRIREDIERDNATAYATTEGGGG